MLVLKHELAIRAYLNGQPDFIALCHWNMNVDNAWFWRDDDGVLQAGLLDWGSVGQMNVAQAFFGMICSAETDFLEAHKGELMALFVAEFQRAGGPAIPLDDFVLMVKLSTAVLGGAWLLDAPSLLEAEVPDIATVTDRYDPKLKGSFLARAQLQIMLVFLNGWRADDIGGVLKWFVARQAAVPSR